jgi:hypothetical protein
MSHLVRATFIAALLLLAALVPRTAHAAPPINLGSVPYTYTDVTSCSFPLTVSGETTIQKVFFQDDRSAMVSFHGAGTVSANGDTFQFFYDGHVTFYADGSFSVSGLQEHVNVPGAGLVIADIGHLVYDPSGSLVLEAGQHDFSVSAYPGLCSYFT